MMSAAISGGVASFSMPSAAPTSNTTPTAETNIDSNINHDTITAKSSEVSHGDSSHVKNSSELVDALFMLNMLDAFTDDDKSKDPAAKALALAAGNQIAMQAYGTAIGNAGSASTSGLGGTAGVSAIGGAGIGA